MLTWIRERYFSFAGRLDRATFFSRYATVYLLVFVPATTAVYHLQETAQETYDLAAPLISILAALLIIGIGSSLVVRRFHDFGFSGYTVVVYYALGGAIGTLRAVALAGAYDVEQVAGRESSVQLMAHGEVNTWLLMWYLPALAWAMTPFLIPGSKRANRFGPHYVRLVGRDGKTVPDGDADALPAPF